MNSKYMLFGPREITGYSEMVQCNSFSVLLCKVKTYLHMSEKSKKNKLGYNILWQVIWDNKSKLDELEIYKIVSNIKRYIYIKLVFISMKMFSFFQ